MTDVNDIVLQVGREERRRGGGHVAGAYTNEGAQEEGTDVKECGLNEGGDFAEDGHGGNNERD